MEAPAPSYEPKLTRLEKVLQSPEGKLYKLQAFVLLAAILLPSIMILRSIRHRTGWSFSKPCLRAATSFSFHALSYVVGLLQDSTFSSSLILVWALFLVVLYNTANDLAIDSLKELDALRRRFLWDYMIPSLWLFLLLLVLQVEGSMIPALLLWLVFLFKLKDKKLALVSACRTLDGLDPLVLVIAEFMKDEHVHTDVQNPNPTTMQGYSYLVGVKEALEQVISVSSPCHEKQLDLSKIATVEKIWQCEEKLFNKSGDPDGHLKDMCLSFAMFWLLLRRFADYELEELSSEESREKTWNFVRKGLIKEQDGEECKRAFKVVEVELHFLYDYFYNSYFAAYCKESDPCCSGYWSSLYIYWCPSSH